MHRTQNFSLTHLESIIDQILAEKNTAGKKGWNELCAAHPSDIADLVENISHRYHQRLFAKLPIETATLVFDRLEHAIQVSVLEKISDEQAAHVFKEMSADDLTDLLESFSDEKAKHYLKLLQKKQRSRILNLMSFDSKSAGGIMNSEIFTLTNDLNVKKSIGQLQRVTSDYEVRYRIYVTDKENLVVGHLTLDQLVLNKPDTPIKNLLKRNELLVNVHDDQEEVVQQMTHYELLSAPVVDEHGHFLGAITGDDIIEVLEEEATEDAYMMSGVGHVEHSYFETPFRRMFLSAASGLLDCFSFKVYPALL